MSNIQDAIASLPPLDLGAPPLLRRTDELKDYAPGALTPHEPIPAPDVYGMIARGNIKKREQEKDKKGKKSKKKKKKNKHKKLELVDGNEPIIIEGPVSARAVNMLKEGIKQGKARDANLKRKKRPSQKSKSKTKSQKEEQPMQVSPRKKARRAETSTTAAPADAKAFPEGFPGLRRWREASFDELLALKQGDWISYTRGKWGGHGAGADDASKGRKKTVCTFFASGTKPDGKQYIRVSSIPLSGARASTVRPNQTLSWDIFPAEQWTREPKYYLMKEEENKKRLKAKARLERRQQKDTPMAGAGKTVTKPQDYEVETLGSSSSSSSSDEEGEVTAAASGSDSDTDAEMT